MIMPNFVINLALRHSDEMAGLEGSYVMNPIMTNLAYGKDGDIWLFQDRGQDDVPVMVHVNDAADTEPYEKYFSDSSVSSYTASGSRPLSLMLMSA